MKKIIYVEMLFLGLCVLGCKKEEIKPKAEQQEFVATLANQVTKTTVTDDGKVSWEATDAIAIFESGSTSPVKATIKSISADGKTAVFTPVTEIASAVGAIYPYDANATLSENVVSISLGKTQSGDFADANVAASKADGYNLSFKNATSVFKFKISDENAKSVKLKATGISGTLNITLGNTISSTLNEDSTSDEITVSNITPETDYYIAVAPKAYDDFQYAWYDNEGKELGTASLGKNITIGAGELFVWGDLVEHEDTEYVKFSDANFKAYCVVRFDTDGDGEISKEEARAVTEIEAGYGWKISSLEGIEYFTNLTRLCCDRSYLTSLDISKNTALTELDCHGNQLTTLDVSKNTALKHLECSSNQLTSLDVSKNTALEFLDCGGNQLTSIDVSNNTALIDLVYYENQLSSIDVSKNRALEYLNCGMNQLTSIDVSNNTALIDLECGWNQLTSIDVSKNRALECLSCLYNQLTSIDVSNNTRLTHLDFVSNQLTSIDVSKNTRLTALSCWENQLSSLDISKNTDLTILECNSNQLTSLDISKNTALTTLVCNNNQISTIYVWKGFDSSQYPQFQKDSFAEYVEVGNDSGNIEDYTIKNPWDI